MSQQDANCRYSVGIDLGTTNCVLAYTDLEKDIAVNEQPEVKVFDITQLTAPGVLDTCQQLPSFLYMAHPSELPAADITLPWSDEATSPTGSIARQLGAKTPLRLVSSAKSWLCHSGIDRHEDFLPISDLEDLEKISPVEATFQYLDHLQQAWNQEHPDYPLSEQQVTITIPASFDPVARELTAEAANFAGFEHLTLLEEPQAAVYNWIRASSDDWRNQVAVGDYVLVVDIGGGTSDLSLVMVHEQDGDLQLERIAVGEHLLLGGDNMDLALAYRLKAKLASEGTELQSWQVQAITQACALAKETLLAEERTSDSMTISIPGRGSKLIASTLTTELTHQEVIDTLIDGFFPIIDIEDKPKANRRGGLSQKGLPYAQDPAITRHLAAFLCRHGDDNSDEAMADPLADPIANFVKPAAVIFNGGVLKSSSISSRLMTIINQWLELANAPTASLLKGNHLDRGVALGASFSGFVRQGHGVRIRAGLAHSYYVGIESSLPAIPGMPSPLQALCIAPFGMEEGTETNGTDKVFSLVVGEPVTFQFF